MTGWLLDYNGASLTISIPSEDVETLPYTSFYKLSLRRFIAENINGLLTGKSSLTYLDFKRIIVLCEKEGGTPGSNPASVPSSVGVYRQPGELFGTALPAGYRDKKAGRKTSPTFSGIPSYRG